MSEKLRSDKDESNISSESKKTGRLSSNSKKISKAQQYLRMRTRSIVEYIANAEIIMGEIHQFNREKGYGFVIAYDNIEFTDKIFFHISDIASDYVPREGDKVTFKIVNIPPKLKEPHAVEIKIENILPEHKKWADSKNKSD